MYSEDTLYDYYTRAFPGDDLGEEINPDATFEGAWDCLCAGEDFYDYMGVGDSLVRERIFEELSNRLDVDYDVVYEQWLHG